jgi:hypothetical protein
MGLVRVTKTDFNTNDSKVKQIQYSIVGDVMRYTYKKISGLLAMLLGVMLISRFAPDWLFYTTLAFIGVFMLYLLYYYSSY